jgi:outer membrane protein TolC
LEEAVTRAISVNKLLGLAGMNIRNKEFTTASVRANYFPQVLGGVAYLHFDEPLGSVLTLRGRPLLGLPPKVLTANVFEENSSWAAVYALQPITDLLKVRQGVLIGRADEAIAQAQLDKGTREVISGVQQLYWGILAVRKIRAGAEQGVQGAELMVKQMPTIEARVALTEAKQGLLEAAKQLAGLEEQLANLLDLPPCTVLDLVEPAPPVLTFACCEDAINLAIAASPEVREAQATIDKARAAVAAGKLEYVPSIAVTGGYLNQTAQLYMQENIGFAGVIGSCTFVDWGKRKNTIRAREMLESMAVLKLQQTQDEVRQKTIKAWREFDETRQTLTLAGELVEARKEVTKQASSPEAMTKAAKDPALIEILLKAVKDQALAQVDYIKAELAHQQAYVQLMTLLGK